MTDKERGSVKKCILFSILSGDVFCFLLKFHSLNFQRLFFKPICLLVTLNLCTYSSYSDTQIYYFLLYIQLFYDDFSFISFCLSVLCSFNGRWLIYFAFFSSCVQFFGQFYLKLLHHLYIYQYLYIFI